MYSFLRRVKASILTTVLTFLLSITIVLCFAQLPQADSAQIGNPVEILRRRYLSLKSLSGNFIETVESAEGDERPMVFEGKFAFQLPNRFRLEVTKPSRQLIVSSDSVILFYFPEEKRAVVQTRAQPFPLLAFLEPLFDTTAKIEEETAGGEKPVILIQTRQESFFTDMRLELDKTKTRVDAFSFTDNWGNRYHFVLTSQRWNPNLSPKLFKFVPPSGTDIEYQ